MRAVISHPGLSLDATAQALFGPRFGHDFSRVRVHSDAEAASSAEQLQATAYTVGHHVVFGREAYNPRTEVGLRLIAHELAHVSSSQYRDPAEVTAIDDDNSSHEDAARTAAFTLGGQGRPPVADLGVVYRQPLNAAAPSPLTKEHQDLRAAAAQQTASDLDFGFIDVLAWGTDPEYLDRFKDNFVYQNRRVITAAAARYDLPAELVAGVARIEIGGKDPIKPYVYQWRNWVPFTSARDNTSLGQQAMQVRRAAASLGYDPKALSKTQHGEIIDTLNDPSQSIFLAAKHLSDLRNVDFMGTAGKDLTLDQLVVIGARYNQGPERDLAAIRKDLSYGRAITRRWSLLTGLLTTPPAPLEYSPVEDNIINPTERAVQQLENGIYKLYGVPRF